MSVQHSHTNHFIPHVISTKTLMKISYENFNEILYVSLIIYNCLSNWASHLGHPNWALVCGLEWDQKGTNKTLAPMGLELFYQLLTSPKLPLIIFNITIRI